MSDTPETQEAPEVQDTASEPADDNIDNLLAEFDAQIPSEPAEQPAEQPAAADGTETSPELEGLLNELAQRDENERIDAAAADITETASMVAESVNEAGGNITQRLANAMVIEALYTDPLFKTAFDARSMSPQEYALQSRRLARVAADEVRETINGRPDPDATADVQAVMAGIQGMQDGTAVEDDGMTATKLLNMSDDDAEKWRKDQAKKLGFNN